MDTMHTWSHFSVHTLPPLSSFLGRLSPSSPWSLRGKQGEAATAVPAALGAKAHHDTVLHRGLLWASGPRTQLSKFQIFFYEHDKFLNISEPRLKQKLFALQSCFESQVRYPMAWHIVGVQ